VIQVKNSVDIRFNTTQYLGVGASILLVLDGALVIYKGKIVHGGYFMATKKKAAKKKKKH
jgi:hypothetical protein